MQNADWNKYEKQGGWIINPLDIDIDTDIDIDIVIDIDIDIDNCTTLMNYKWLIY